MTVSTPCIRVCVLDQDTGLCLGCGRTASEIGGWLAMGEDARRRTMAELPARLASLSPKASATPPAGESGS